MGNAVKVLLNNLSRGGNLAMAAAEALETQAGRNAAAVSGETDRIVPYLNDSNFGLRAAIAKVLGKIGTEESIAEIQNSLLAESPETLETMCSYSCWSAEPL